VRISRPSIIDFEASGLGFDSFPIEVGVVLSSGDRYCALIKPEPVWQYWDEAAEGLHGLTRAELVEHGKSVRQVAQELNAFLANRVVYCDGWVVDKAWLSKLYFYAGMEPKFSLSALEMILREAQMEIWNDVKRQVLADLSLVRHRASTDAMIIQETFFRTFELTREIKTFVS